MFSFFRSLRWRLQAWHAMILIMVVVVFGGLLRWEMATGHWDRIDEELLSAARVLEGSMMAVPPPVLESMLKDVINDSPGQRRPPPIHVRPRPREGGLLPPISSSPSPQPKPNGPRVEPLWPGAVHNDETVANFDPRWIGSIELPTHLLEQLGREDGSAYFAVWNPDNSFLRTGRLREAFTPSDHVRYRLQRNTSARLQRGPFREVYIPGPRQTIICVGRPVMHEQAKIDRLTLFIIGCGLGVVMIGLLGGWWMSQRAIAPIELISQTAQSITGSKLGDRVDISGFDRELNGLGKALNSMLDRLSDSFEQQRQFTADASHELRTPVSVILTASELALSKPRTPEEYREQLQKCQRAAQRMWQLTDSLLTLARLDSNAELEFESFCLHDVVAELVHTLAPMAFEQKAIKINSEISPSVIHGNAILIRQAFSNLIINAIKYTNPSGTIHVRLLNREGSVLFEVIDNGIGIESSEIPKLFDRFYRVDKSRNRAEGGTGLGLAITKRIVECHQGLLSAESTLGSGSTFRIQLPTQVPQA